MADINIQSGEMVRYGQRGEEQALQFGSEQPREMMSGASQNIEESRAIQEIQASIIMARRFPRDPNRSVTNVLRECKRYGLAEKALYRYSRGGQEIKGETIRLLEVIARHWGNLDYGYREISQANGASEVQAFAVDWENNVRVTRTFYVRHTRDKKSGTEILKSDRDIYEHMSSQAQRRVRSVIAELIPGDIIEIARKECEKTLKLGDGTKSTAERIRDMVIAFDTVGITKGQIETYLKHPIDQTIPDEIASMTEIFRSIKDGFADRFEIFPVSVNGFTPPTKQPPPPPPKAEEETSQKGKTVTTPPKEETKAAPADPLSRDVWFNLRTAGYKPFVLTNISLIKNAPSDVVNEMKAKWFKFYGPAVPWPLDFVPPPAPPAPPAAPKEPPAMVVTHQGPVDVVQESFLPEPEEGPVVSNKTNSLEVFREFSDHIDKAQGQSELWQVLEELKTRRSDLTDEHYSFLNNLVSKTMDSLPE